MIAAASVPTFEPCIGTELYHAEGNDSARVGMSVSPGSDKGIDEIGEAFGGIKLAGKKYDTEGKEDYR